MVPLKGVYCTKFYFYSSMFISKKNIVTQLHGLLLICLFLITANVKFSQSLGGKDNISIKKTKQDGSHPLIFI